MNNIMSSGGLLGTGSGAYGNRNPFRGFWNTPDDTLLSGMTDPYLSRVNSMWNRWAPEGTAMPGTFGEWETAIRGYMPDAPMTGNGGGSGGGGRAGWYGGGRLDNLGGGWRGSGPRPVGAPSAGTGSGGGTSGGGTGTPAPNQMTWAFPQYSQTWAFTPPAAPPVTLPPVFKKSAYETSKEKDRKK